MKSRILSAAAALLFFATSAISNANAEELKKVKIAHGNPLMLSAVFELYVPLAMGWWKDEGLDVDVLFSQGTSAAVQNIIGGGAEIGMGNTTPWLSADTKGLTDIRMVAAMRNTSWRILTMADSGITTPQQLKGKTIGLAVAGSGGAMYLDTMLRRAGLDPQNDVRKVVIGLGAQAFDAIASKRVDAALTFMGEIATFKALGNDATYFQEDEWLNFPDYSLFATEEAIKKDPTTIEKLARGIVKAQVFAEASPECVAKIFRKNHGGANRKLTLAQDTEIEKSNLAETDLVLDRAGGKYRANVSAEGLDKLQNFLKDNGAIEKTIDVSKLMPDDKDFFHRINDFDHEAVRAEAIACKGF